MNKTKIEWVKNPPPTHIKVDKYGRWHDSAGKYAEEPGYTWNPITGCLNGCSYCYARKLANGRLKQRYLANLNIAPRVEKDDTRLVCLGDYNDPFYPRFWPEKVTEPLTKQSRWGSNRLVTHRQSAKGIFVCDMGELFGHWIPREWQENIFWVIRNNPKHRFYLLTKQPQNLIKWSPFPENCWVGITATNQKAHNEAVVVLSSIKASIKFISHEPLLEHISLHSPYSPEDAYDWDIIGACTGTKPDMEALIKRYPSLTLMQWGKKWTAQPQISWVEEIIKAAGKASIPIFLKNNLKSLIGNKVATYQAILSVVYRVETDNGYKLRQEMPK